MRGAVAALVAIAGLVLASFGQLEHEKARGQIVDEATATERLLLFIGVGVALIVGVAAVRSFSRALNVLLREQDGTARGATAGFVVSVVGYMVITLAVLSALGRNLSGLLLGGAVTGVIVGIAAQQTIGNFFAGLVLMIVRPFSVGENIVLRSGPLGGEYEGTVTDLTLFYVHLVTDQGPVALPNSGVLASAIGPGAHAKPEEQMMPPDDHGPAHGGTP